ncbi:choice-of-anchor W domain-containing protein [Nostoc sp. CMAA1605]|uniref:choice-of-anchor W domain-containing protein n=1 Tax=Nostoc sp. CMAA1605 TaxID=2055159 RepID=UPI001F2BDB4E|nr:choice-of-anchor W domain-containing protein [Nostoc sp. CMAA1605]
MLSSKLFSSKSKFLTALGLTTISLLLTTNAAQAFTLVNRAGFTDAEFEDLQFNGDFTELFVAEGRIGNNSLSSAERELGLNTPLIPSGSNLIGGIPVVSGQRVWGNGTPVNFSLEYTGSQVNYIVDGQLLSTTSFTGAANSIFIRTRAADNSFIELSNLVFDGTAIGDTVLSSVSGTGRDIDYLQISDISQPFTLTGQVLMSWTDAVPRNSALAYQIKVGSTPTSVPEPGMVGAMFLAGVAAVGYGKKKSSVNNSKKEISL